MYCDHSALYGTLVIVIVVWIGRFVAVIPGSRSVGGIRRCTGTEGATPRELHLSNSPLTGIQNGVVIRLVKINHLVCVEVVVDHHR